MGPGMGRDWGTTTLLRCGVALVVLALGLGCELDRRDVLLPTAGGENGAVNSLQPAPGVGGGGAAVGGEGGANSNLPLAGGQTEIAAGAIGAVCQQATDCDAGNCVDGVCCDSACTELCAACNVPGSLGVCSAASSDPLCPAPTCEGQSSECRPLDGGQTAINCEAVGVCRGNAACSALPAAQGTPCQQGTGTCDGQGACLVPDKSALGAACALDADCAEGHCVSSGADGTRVCCDAACDGTCQACSAAGRCEVTPPTDTRCEAVTCPADNVCRNYADSITDNLCRSFGQCRTALDCATADFFTSLRPTAQCVCDAASGNCALAAATTCAQGTECASGACVPTALGNQVCCSGACAPGLFCSSTGTGCVQCEGSQLDCDGNDQRTCDAGALVTTPCPNGCTPGVGCNALPPVGFLCDAGQCAAGGVCQQDTGAQARCCVRNCAAEGKVCSPSGSCDCPPGQVAVGNGCLLEPGDPCQTTAQCQAGLSCTDGVCCQEACSGFCERCQSGSGLCAAVAAGQQEVDAASGNSCSNGFECTGVRNGCRARTGQACTATDGSGCVSGACEATAGGGASVCCSQACGAGLFCRSTGQGCVQCESAAQCGNGCNVAQGTCNPLGLPGATCSVASQCSTNGCVPAADGGGFSRCCANCAPGQLCTAQGVCINAQSDLGGSCSRNADCRVGVCSTGRCCATACDTNCEACSAGGACQSNGQCDAFDCIVPNPPVVVSSLPAANDVFILPGLTPPSATGGTVRDGRYTPVQIDIYADLTSGIFVPTYEFRGRSVQIAEQDFFQFSPPLGFLPERHYTGTFTATGTTLSFDTELCESEFAEALRTQTVQYTAGATGLILISQQLVGTVVITYARQ
jgi:hypothetical protein